MSRTEMFFLLACAAVAAVISTDPASSRQPVSIASLLTPAPEIVAWNQTDLSKHDLETP